MKINVSKSAMMIKCLEISDDDNVLGSAMMIKCLKISDDDKTDSGLAMMIKLTCGIGISDDDKLTLRMHIVQRR